MRLTLRRGRWRRWAWIVPVALLVAWAWRRGDLPRSLRLLRAVDPWWAAMAVLLNLVGLVTHALRWRAVVVVPLAASDTPTTSPGRPRRRDVLTALVVGQVGALVLPARLGELARGGHLARTTQLPVATVLGTVLLDHLLTAVAMVPLWLALPLLPGLPAWMAEASRVVVPLVLLLLVLSLLWTGGLAPEERPRWRWLRRVSQLRQGLRAVRTWRAVRWSLFWAAIGWGAEAVVLAAALQACAVPTSVTMVLLVLLAVNAAVAVPLAPANAGTLELGAVAALTALGVEPGRALAAAVAYHVAQLASVWLAMAACWRLVRPRTQP